MKVGERSATSRLFVDFRDVECLDEENQALPSYGQEDCLPLQMDAVEAQVQWREKKNLQPLRGRPFKLRFHLYNARLYSYRCA